MGTESTTNTVHAPSTLPSPHATYPSVDLPEPSGIGLNLELKMTFDTWKEYVTAELRSLYDLADNSLEFDVHALYQGHPLYKKTPYRGLYDALYEIFDFADVVEDGSELAREQPGGPSTGAAIAAERMLQRGSTARKTCRQKQQSHLRQ